MTGRMQCKLDTSPSSHGGEFTRYCTELTVTLGDVESKLWTDFQTVQVSRIASKTPTEEGRVRTTFMPIKPSPKVEHGPIGSELHDMVTSMSGYNVKMVARLLEDLQDRDLTLLEDEDVDYWQSRAKFCLRGD